MNMNNKKGYTLVELIITLAVIAIMIVPIFNTFTESIKVNIISKREISGAYLAQNVLEDLKTHTKSELDDLVAAGPTDPLRSYTETSAETVFNVSVTVADVTSTLGITESISSIANQSVPDPDLTFNFPLDGFVGNVDFYDSVGDISLLSSTTSYIIRMTDAGSQVVVNVNGTSRTITPRVANNLQINFTGPDPAGGTVNNNSIQLFNGTAGVTLNTTRVNDSGNISVIVKPDELSTSDIWIGNAMPAVIGEVSAPENWYNIIIEVEHDGIKYEVLESTIGK